MQMLILLRARSHSPRWPWTACCLEERPSQHSQAASHVVGRQGAPRCDRSIAASSARDTSGQQPRKRGN